MSVNSTMKALADEVRELSGKTGALTLGNMTDEVASGNEAISDQTALISQIRTALQGKAAGGGTGKPEQEKTVEITQNGEHTITPDEGYTLSKVTANVNVPDVPAVVDVLDVTENGAYNAADEGLDGFSVVTVNVPDVPAVVEELSVTENGTYEPDDGVDGFSKVTVNVASSGGGDTGLPAGYRRVDYIQFTGEQLVDTGIIGTQDTQINASFTWEISTQRHLFGCTSSDNTASVTSYMNGSWRFGNKSQTKTVSSKNEKLSYSCLVNKTTISLNSSVTAISGVNDFETVGTLLLGGARDSDGSLPSVGITGKVFYFMLWNGDEQVRKLVPVVSADGVYRFFDLVTKTFFDSITDTPLGGGNI